MQAPKKREWPKIAAGPLGNTAVFQCPGDVPAGWEVLGEKAAKVDPVVPAGFEELDLAAARADYHDAFGKKPGPRWDAAEIRSRIASGGRVPVQTDE